MRVESKSLSIIALVVGLALSALGCGRSPGPEKGGVSVETDGPSSLTIRLTTTDFSTLAAPEKGGDYVRIEVPGFGRDGEIGRPELPVKSVLIEVPAGVSPRAKVVSADWRALPGRFRIHPRQRPVLDVSGASRRFDVDLAFYRGDAEAPSAVVKLSPPGMIRGRQVVELKICPFKYRPGTGELLWSRDLEVRLSWSGRETSAARRRKARLASQDFEPLVRSLILNYRPVGAGAESESETGPKPDAVGPQPPEGGADYLIVAHDPFVSGLAPLVDWNTRKGYRTFIAPMSQIGTTRSQLLAYVIDAYEHWDPAPSYLLLVGDYDQVPSHTALDPDENAIMTDFPYTCPDGDYFPDLSLGRMAVGDTTELTAAVNKIIKYDREPAGTWYDDALLCAFFEDANRNCYTDRWFLETAAHAQDFLDGATTGYTVFTSYVSDFDTTGLPCSPAYWDPQMYVHQPARDPEVPADVVAQLVRNGVGTSRISQAFNSGVGLVLHRDHGYDGGWDRPAFSTVQVEALTNGDMTPVVLSLNCSTGRFDSYYDCLAESFLVKPNGGAVGVVAPTRDSYSGYNDLLTHGLFTAFWPAYDPTHGETTYPNSFKVAETLNFGKYYLRTYEGLDPYTLYTFRIYEWFGDPLTELRTADPFTLPASHPATLAYGATAFKVSSAVSGARAALSQHGRVLGVGIINGGSVDITFAGLNRAEPVNVTLTAHNADPYEGTAAVVLPSDGELYWDREVFGPTDTARLALADADLAGGDTIGVEIFSDSHPTPVRLTLTATPAGSGFFEGDAALGTLLPVSDGDTLSARYLDADDGGGGLNVEKFARADVDGGPPVFAGLAEAQGYHQEVRLSWAAGVDSHGPIVYRVYRGDTVGGIDYDQPIASLESLTYTDPGRTNCEDYFYAVRAEDVFGNRDGNIVVRSAVPSVAGQCAAEQFGNDGSARWGYPGRGNIYYASKPATLSKVEVMVRVDPGTVGYFFVYESDFPAGDYRLVSSVPSSAQGSYPNRAWFYSPDLSVPLHMGKYYYIGLAANTTSLYSYYGGTAPLSASFGQMVTGVADLLVTYPPGPTLTLNYASGSAAPNDQRLTTCSPRARDGFLELDRALYRADAEVVVAAHDLDLICTGSLNVEVFSQSDPTPVQVTLTETPAASGTFYGAAVLGLDVAVAGADTVNGRYRDLDLGDGSSADKFDRATVDGLPPQFAGVQSARPGDAAVFLSWSAASDPHPPVAYRVYRASTFNGQNFSSPLATISGTTYTDGAVTNGETYYYVVRAVDSLGYEDGNTAQRGTIPQARQLIYSFPLDADPAWTAQTGWAFGVPQGLGACTGDPTSGHTGTNVFGYNLAGNYGGSINPTRWLTTTAFNLTGYSSVQLRYWRWLGVESFYFDKTYVSASNNGSTWQVVWNHDPQICDAVWTQAAHDLSAVADDRAAVQVRWGMGPTNNAGQYPGWNIDDVEIWGIPIFVDSDADGLADLEESAIGSNPYDPDSDSDGLDDYDEFNVFLTDPLEADTDFDFADDWFEVMQDGTDPLDPHDYRGAVPHYLNYSGRLLDASGRPLDETVALTAALYGAAAGGTALWADTLSTTVERGIFHCLLGPVPAAVFDRDELYLGVAVGAGPELNPRQPVAAVPRSVDAELVAGSRVDSGEAIVVISPAAASAVIPVRFPRRFVAPPRLGLSASSLVVGAELFVVTRAEVRADGAVVTIESASGAPAQGTASLIWFAHGK